MIGRFRFALAGALLLSCSGDRTATRTQTQIEIDAQPGVKAALGASGDLRVVVTAGETLEQLGESPRSAFDETLEPAQLPWWLALSPQSDDADRVYAVLVTARDAEGGLIAQVRLISGYVSGTTRYVRILLEDACLGSECEALQTCHLGGCSDAQIDAERLSTDGAAPTAIGGSPPAREQPASDAGEPEPASCAQDTVCSSVFPCVVHADQTSYVCRGQFPEWTKLGVVGPYEMRDGVVTDTNTRLQWQQVASGEGMSWRDAGGYCAELRLAEHDDWRLPSKSELESLVKDTAQYPAIDTQTFADTPHDAGYWTSTPSARDRNFAWMVSFTIGYSNADELKERFYVRCVR